MKLELALVTKYVEDNIGVFHDSRLASLKKIKLKTVLENKNPYLYKAKNVNSASEIVSNILSAHLSSSEEAIFGNWLEKLAIFINFSVYGGRKSSSKSIDLDFDRDGVRYLVAIKSGPNWANSAQYEKLGSEFLSVKKTLSTSGSIVNIQCVNGCSYGKSDPSSDFTKYGFHKICGQRFWELISGDPNLFVNIIEPLGTESRERNERFATELDLLKNRLEREFLEQFCNKVGAIDWEKLVRFNSQGVDVKIPR